jgi:hypothetical protein
VPVEAIECPARLLRRIDGLAECRKSNGQVCRSTLLLSGQIAPNNTSAAVNDEN